MPTDNVVPIDDDAARVLARQPVRFRWFVAAVVATWLGVLVPVLLFTPLPPLLPFLALATLMVLAEHRFVLFGDETAMTGSIVVAVASVFFFANDAPFAGPILVASLGGLYLPHLRYRHFGLVFANCSTHALAVACSCCVASLTNPTVFKTFGLAAPAVVAAVGAYWLANCVLIGVATWTRSGTEVLRSINYQVKSDGVVLVLAFGAAIAGVAGAEASTVALLGLILVPLVAFEIRLNVQRKPDRNSYSSHADARVLVLCTTAALLLAATTTIGVSLACTALFLALTYHQWRTASISALTATVGGATTALLLQSASVPVVAQAAAVAVVVFALLSFTEIGVRLKRASVSISPYVVIGATIPGTRDIPRLAGAAAVASLVAFGANSTGLFFASSLVILGVGASSVRISNQDVTDDHDSAIAP